MSQAGWDTLGCCWTDHGTGICIHLCFSGAGARVYAASLTGSRGSPSMVRMAVPHVCAAAIPIDCSAAASPSPCRSMAITCTRR